MAWLTALGVNPSSAAAARNDPVRAAASKARSARRGRWAMRKVNTIHLLVQIWRIFVLPGPNHIPRQSKQEVSRREYAAAGQNCHHFWRGRRARYWPRNSEGV